MAKEVIVKADKVKKRKVASRVIKISLLLLLLFLVILYIILEVIYNGGKFTVSLDSNKDLESGLAIFDSLNNSHGKRRLEATAIRFMDNISYKWLPENIDTEASGSHNGENYIAYTFYIENQGKEVLHYWYEVICDDVIKNVDEAIRIRIYRNGVATTYAKRNYLDHEPEKDTVPFKDIEDAKGTIILEEVKDFTPGTMDRITIVVWIEGDDPDCNDPLIGGEMKMHMIITENHVEQSKE
jgi:adenylate cyclase class IV